MHDTGLTTRPVWAVALLCLLVWMLAETMYNWLAIDAVSRSGLPLFPTYKPAAGTSAWPADRSFIELRECVRKLEYHFSAAAIGQIDGMDYLRCSIYESPDRRRHLSLLFVPRPNGTLQAFMSVLSILESGQRVVTDNIFMPYGGFYPENVYLERHPLVRTLQRLMRIHERRLATFGLKETVLDMEPVTDMNAMQRETEQLNVNLGFLVEPSEREELGHISRVGRYRLWKELWTLNYLGRTKNYC